MPKVKHSVRDISDKSHKGYKRNTGRRTLRGSNPKDEIDQKEVAAKKASSVQPQTTATQEDGEDADDKFNAYKAVLTLLKAEDEPKRPSSKSSKKIVDSDHVEGLDENQETEMVESEDEIDGEDDNEGDMRDPFETHFAAIEASDVAELAVKPVKTIKCPRKILGKKSVLRVREGDDCSSNSAVKSVDSLKIKYRLKAPFNRVNGEELTDLQKELAAPMLSYRDIFYPNRTYEDEEQLQTLYSMHILNHIYKTRDRVLKNNAKLSAAEDSMDVEYRDQGFTRPKVLVLLPTRNAAWKFVNKMTDVSGLSQVENRKRFKDAFYHEGMPPQNKPEDFRKLFAGNIDDMFCLGVKFTRQATKLYSSFYNSDLIVASPLGLKLVIGHEKDKSKKQDYDFLSSIEVLLLDQAEGMYMQTWDNVDHILKHMNLTPRESHGCDFSRVRNWYLEENSKYLRQTIVMSEFSTPEMNHCFTKYCHNIAGLMKCRQFYDKGGAMARIGLSIRQTFSRIEPPEPQDAPNMRFKHFTSVTLPSLFRSSSEKGTLIFVPSYMDFVRLRNYMDRENISCSSISEYTDNSNVNRARSWFKDGRTKMIMITERFHHFKRFLVKGVNQVIFYGLPENPRFYKEIVLFLARTAKETETDLSIYRTKVIYSKWDSLKVERIVGSDRIGVLFEGIGETYEFS